MIPLISPASLGFSRRELLRFLVSLSAFLPASMLLAAVPGKGPVPLPAFGPFLDTLLPEDESPSASQLGLEAIILAGARRNPRLMQLIELGCAWLDRQAIQTGAIGFASLDEPGRIALVSKAEQSGPRSLPKGFFTAMHSLAFREYYAQPATWKSLGYSGPPQPAGFAGHDRAPAQGL